MKSYKEVLIENQYPNITSVADIEKLENWLNTLDFKGKTPRGYKAEKDALVSISDKLDVFKQYPSLEPDDNTYNIYNLYVSKLDINRVNAKFGAANNTEPSSITKKYATYIKNDARSYKRFLSEIDNIESFLATLSGYHKKALGGLVIKFVSPKAQKSIAKYVTSDDIIQINLKKVGNTSEEYGSLRYIVLHELGHRYLKKYRQRWNYDSFTWITTKYSTVDSFSGEEKFAELFAISHWSNKYSEYSDKIKLFKKEIT